MTVNLMTGVVQLACWLALVVSSLSGMLFISTRPIRVRHLLSMLKSISITFPLTPALFIPLGVHNLH